MTAFLHTDGAFRRAAGDILGKRFHSERRVYRSLWRAGGLDGVENVLLYHLVAGRTLTSHRLVSQSPTKLRTVQGHKVRIRLQSGQLVVLDRDKASPDARVISSLADINEGNRQVAHGMTAMLSPVVS